MFEVIGALVGILILYLNYPDAMFLGYLVAALTGGLTVAIARRKF